MNSTNNDFYKNAALKVFAQLGQLIEEDENITKNKRNDKAVESLYLAWDELEPGQPAFRFALRAATSSFRAQRVLGPETHVGVVVMSL